MSVYAGPEIVTNGLVLELDAANQKSYPGSGTAWNDLSGQNNNGTLVNGVTYSTNNNGTMIFDGIDDYITVSNGSSLIQNKTSFTVGIVFKMNALASLRGLIGTLNYVCGTNLGLVASNTTLSFYNDTGTCFSASIGNWVEVDKWLFAFGTYDGTTTTVYGYKDGVLTKSSDVTKSGATNTFTSTFRIWGNNYALNFTNCYGPLAQVYNRALTENEIRQNINAIRGRYGI